VPEIGGQDRQAPLGVITVSIPVQQSLDCKSVTKIMQAWATTGALRTQSNLSRQVLERAMDFAFVQAATLLIHEEVRLCARTKATVPAFRVIIQNLTRRGMQG
jgi:hypothetical protein